MENTFKVNDFATTDHITKDVIGKILENIFMFQERYSVACGYMEIDRCNLRFADESLFDEIYSFILDILGIEIGDTAADDIFDEIEVVFG